MSAPKNIPVRKYEQAIRNHAGIQSLVAKELGVSRAAVTQRIQASPRLQTALRECKELILDTCEDNFVKAINGGDGQTSRWYSERQGVERGYGTKSQVETKLADGELEALIAAFGGDIKKIRAFRASLDPPEAGKP